MDPDGDDLTFSLSSGVANGTLSLSGAEGTYTPNANFFGTDSLTFTVNDGTASSTTGIIVFDVAPVDDDAPFFSADRTTLPTASVDQFYQSSLRGLALDPDETELTYTLLEGPDWLSIDEAGMLSGTPSLSDVGFYTWTLQATDTTGQTAVSELELRVVDGDVFGVAFEDFNSSASLSTLLANGSSENVTVTSVPDGLGYLYSVSHQGVDYDGDGIDDTLNFDVRVRAWREGTIELGLDGPGATTSSSATIGTTESQVVVSSGTFTVGDTDMNDGESIEFLVENLEIQLTDSSYHGTAFSEGFSAAFLTQIANTANSHQVVFGSGENLLGYDFNSNQRSETSRCRARWALCFS